jgi:hypothetical protein
MMFRQSAQQRVIELQREYTRAVSNAANLQSPLSRAPGSIRETARRNVERINKELQSAIGQLGKYEGKVKGVTVKWPKFDYSKGLAWNLRLIERTKQRMIKSLYEPPKVPSGSVPVRIPWKPVPPKRVSVGKLLGIFTIPGLTMRAPIIPKPKKPAMPKIPAIKVPATKLTATDSVTPVINRINAMTLQDKSMTITTFTRERPLAIGGIVTHATHALLGERGPEAVIPLSNPARATQVMRMAGLIGSDYKRYGGRSGPQGAGNGMGVPVYNVALNLPSGLVVSDVDRFGRQISPYVDRTILLAENRRRRGEAGL